MTVKNKCLDDLKVYYGISPYHDHISIGSGIYYLWIKTKYDKKLIKECEEELGVNRI